MERSIPRFHHRRCCSRQGEIVCGYAGSNRTLKWVAEVSAHCTTGACLQREGTVAIARWVVSRQSIRLLHHSLSQVSCLPFYALDRLSGLSRGTTRCYLSAVASRSQEPTTRSRVGCIWCPNWKMVVMYGFLCLRYSATGRSRISSGNTKIFLFVTILDTNRLAQKVVILGAKNPLNFNRGRNLAAFAREN